MSYIQFNRLDKDGNVVPGDGVVIRDVEIDFSRQTVDEPTNQCYDQEMEEYPTSQIKAKIDEIINPHPKVRWYEEMAAYSSLNDGRNVALVTVGPSGSGKTTWAEETATDLFDSIRYDGNVTCLTAQDLPEGPDDIGHTPPGLLVEPVKLSRDYVRDLLSKGQYSQNVWDWSNEPKVTDYISAIIRSTRGSDYYAGISCLCLFDDTNLNMKFLKIQIETLVACGYDVYIKLMDNLGPAECVGNIWDRFEATGRAVPMDVYQTQAVKFWDRPWIDVFFDDSELDSFMNQADVAMGATE